MEQPRTILEICLDSVESCIAAERGGAHRVELCAELDAGGTTPSAGMIAEAREQMSIGLHVMIRPRGGDFCYTDAEFEVMRKDIAIAKQLGAHGVVFGVLTRDGRIDVPRTSALTELARPMNVTFHRAFDLAEDPCRSLEDLIASGVDRVLTSGQGSSAPAGQELIAMLVRQAEGRIAVMPGGGITADNARALRDGTGVGEIHVGSGVYISDLASNSNTLFAGGTIRAVDPVKVARILEILK